MSTMRVVRGPDWKWGNQDGGEGMVGTAFVGDREDGWTTVIWDNGGKNHYRTGAENAHELYILDVAILGTKHPGIRCCICDEIDIQGYRWKCTDCDNYDLCNNCYNGDKHDISHHFYRVSTPESSKSHKYVRKGSAKLQAKGFYKGAKVVRGQDWEWGDQDGCKPGTIVECDVEGAGIVKVRWDANSHTNQYHTGHGGKLDIKCLTPASGPKYYRDHLAILGSKTTSKVKSDKAKLFAQYLAAGAVSKLMKLLSTDSEPVQSLGCAGAVLNVGNSAALNEGSGQVLNEGINRPALNSGNVQVLNEGNRTVLNEGNGPAINEGNRLALNLGSLPFLNEGNHPVQNAGVSIGKCLQLPSLGTTKPGVCAYFHLAKRVLLSLELSKAYFEPKFDMCYCETCHEKRRDKPFYVRGDPPERYVIPVGWVRFGLRLNTNAVAQKVMDNWHVAFHGTKRDKLETILHSGGLIKPGDYGIEGRPLSVEEGHFTDNRKPVGFDIKQIFVSPSIIYCSKDAYATRSPVDFDGQKCQARFVFQLRIKPGYQVSKQTTQDANNKTPIDPYIDNDKLEWSVKSHTMISLNGLLIKVEPN